MYPHPKLSLGLVPLRPFTGKCCFRYLMTTKHAHYHYPGCSAAEEGNMEWVRLYPCSQTNIPCSQFHPLFSGSTIKRHCDSLGDYSLPDMSRCTLLQSKGWSLNPFAILWITFSTRYPPTDSPSLTSIQNEVGTKVYVRIYLLHLMYII